MIVNEGPNDALAIMTETMAHLTMLELHKFLVPLFKYYQFEYLCIIIC